MKHAKPLPTNANELCTKCKQLILPDTPCYHIDNDKMGRANCTHIRCWK